MKRSLGTELCCLLGPDGGTGIFGGLLRQSGQHRFPSCSYDAIQKQDKKKKKKSSIVFRGFLPSLENKLSCRHQGKGPRLYTAAEAESKGLVER